MNIPTKPHRKTPQELAYDKEKLRFENSYLYIETNFKRTSQPIFVLACCESQRRIKLNVEAFLFKSDEEILQMVSQFVKDDFYTSSGTAGIWGKISSYIWHHRDAESYLFHTDGSWDKLEVLSEDTKATLSIKGRSVC